MQVVLGLDARIVECADIDHPLGAASALIVRAEEKRHGAWS